jgi:hypothetical protein
VTSNQQKDQKERSSAFQSPSLFNTEIDSNQNQTSNAKNEKIRQLRMRMQEIEKSQSEMDNRMKTLISAAE